MWRLRLGFLFAPLRVTTRRGVAFMCQHFGVHGVIFMPVTTPQQKIQKTRIFGGDTIEIRLVGDYFDDTLAEAQRYCTAQSGHFFWRRSTMPM